MRILADVNIPEAYISALRGDDHDVVYSPDVDSLGPTATDEAIIEYAESESFAILTRDVKDFGSCEATVPVFVAPQNMSGGEIRAAVARIESMPFDPAQCEPLWLSNF